MSQAVEIFGERATSDSFRVGLLRQRRFLLLVTFALVAYYGADVSLGQEAEAQGLKLHIGRPQFFLIGMWAVWGWAYWRYWQYERTASDAEYRASREREIHRAGVELARRKIVGEVQAGSYVDRGVVPHARLTILPPDGQGPAPTMDGGLLFRHMRISGYDERAKSAISLTGEATLTSQEKGYAERQGRLAFAASRPYVADYKLPYVLALLAPLAMVVRWVFG